MANSTKRVFADIFNELIANRQEHTGESIIEIADKIGISKSSLSAYMKGGRSPNSDALLLIANHFHVSCDYLLGISCIRTQEVAVHEMCKQLGLSETSIHTLRWLANNDEEMQSPETGDCGLAFLDEIIERLPWSYLCKEYYVLQQIREKNIENEQNDTRGSAFEQDLSGHWWVSMFGGTAAKFIAREIGDEISGWLLDTKTDAEKLKDARADVDWLEMFVEPWDEDKKP